MGTSSGLGASRLQSASTEDSNAELLEVPAAVVCALCGNPDCPGCQIEEPTHASGVVAIVPWERTGLGFATRLWSTAMLATTRSRAFFGALPDGELTPALTFALACEACAVGGLLSGTALLGVALVPQLPHTLLADRVLAALVLHWATSGTLALVGFMVFLHALHGVALDWAAQREHAPKPGRGLRFGLYTCGWDVVTLPAGLLVLAAVEGVRAARRAAPLGVTAPMHAAEAYLVGVRGLEPDAARRAARRALHITALPILLLLAAGAALATFWLG